MASLLTDGIVEGQSTSRPPYFDGPYVSMKKVDNVDKPKLEEEFTNIINALKDLGKVCTTSKNVRKILRSLPKTWEAKVTVIQEAKHPRKLPLEELIGSLMAHEIIMKEHLEDRSKKKKSIALKTIYLLKVDPEDEDSLDEDDIAYFSLKFLEHDGCEKDNLIKVSVETSRKKVNVLSSDMTTRYGKRDVGSFFGKRKGTVGQLKVWIPNEISSDTVLYGCGLIYRTMLDGIPTLAMRKMLMRHWWGVTSKSKNVNVARNYWISQVTHVILARANPMPMRGDSYVSE
ncbi:zf-CCHC domain-containing protein/DUF4219 domain-containing protein/UBN2 domain-containing protein [Cucumis melo var. makuwa]|uniref:Zf-CCHC domain-containing protein/DUF4219 domain-containing protein/UBN2 domain-containing protein n=1 Tax=Cucumis melo var. makuwa TaxID=1194695 RepID=A0A5A7VFP5_CUCMM|nr:zf-CCHC domain-containing protein/DUF4219 domain-containing protein/UBN2 domain-containing protein [Cucumis melo var. makuwa]TYK15120.1 zf-CCHC domain-containing protein/DUF4219 domain-containing protein/UBN2 domain-containing protein [Cucumis melo var. makuwa]